VIDFRDPYPNVSRPPAGPVPWKITRLKGVQNPDKPPIVAKSWHLARAIAMLEQRVEYHEVELEQVAVEMKENAR